MAERHDYLMGSNLLTASEDASNEIVKEKLAANAVPYFLKDISETLRRMEQTMSARAPDGKK